MEMEHCLSGGLSVILDNIIAIAAQGLPSGGNDLFCQNHSLGSQFLRYLTEIRVMCFGKDQRVPSGSRPQIQDDSEIFVLIQGGRGNLPRGNFAKDTIDCLLPP